MDSLHYPRTEDERFGDVRLVPVVVEAAIAFGI